MQQPLHPRVSSSSQLPETGSSVSNITSGQWWWYGGSIFLAAIVVHLTALPGSFFWDDYDWVVNNPRVRDPDGLFRLWFDISQYDYWPMHYTTHWFEWRAWGEWAPPFRVLNQLMHGADCLLLWIILRWMRIPGAWLCAMIFAVHPINVESVVWISQRKTVQSTGFVFGSLLCYFRYYDTSNRRWYAAALLLFVLGLLTKTAVVMWPVAMLVCVWWRQQKLQLRDLLACGPFLAVSFVLGVVGTLMRGEQLGIEFAREDSFLSRLAISGDVVWFYVFKTMWPFGFSVVYPRWELGHVEPLAFAPLAALISLFVVCVVYRKKWGAAALAAGGYYFINLFPVLGFVPIMFMRYSLVADHWQYLALPGLLALVVGVAVQQWRRFPGLRYAGPAVATSLVLMLAYGSLVQSAIWSGAGNEPIWRDALSKNPHSELPHLRLGFVLAQRGEFTEAVSEIAESMKYTVPPVLWGPPQVDPRRMALATGHPYEQVGLETADDKIRIAYALATALHVLGQDNMAFDYLDACVKQAPQFAAAHYNLSLVLDQLGYTAEAEAYRRNAKYLAENAATP